MNKSEQLIACLEGEIAKRDTRIVELERAEKNDAIAYKAVLERQDELRAELAALKAQDTVGEVVGWYRLDRPYEMTSYPSVCATWHKLGAPVAQLYAAPAATAADALYEAVTPNVVEWLRCGLAANNRLVDGTHPALERVRAALAANRSTGVV